MGFTDTLNKIGKVPDDSVTDSQEAPDPGAAVKARPSPPNMLSGCSAGAVPPMVNLKLSEGREAVRGAVVTVRVTCTVCGVAPAAAIVTVPVKVPGVVRPAVTMPTLAVPDTVPGLTAFAVSHVPPAGVVAAVAVKANPEVPPTVIVFGFGMVPPI